MKTIMQIGEYLGDPILGYALVVILILPALWGLFKFLEWINLCDSGRMTDIIEDD